MTTTLLEKTVSGNPRMRAFLKEILTLSDGDTFHIPGKSAPVKLNPDRVKKWVSNFNQMRQKGIRVPAPWVHQDKAGKYPTPSDKRGIVMGNDFANDGENNAGFWERLAFDDSTKTLYGILEAPGDPNDPNSPAGKIGTTVQEVSVYASPGWKDGAGDTWDESILHIGCVTSPIERGQKNFVPLQDNELYLCMSFREPVENPDDAQAPEVEPEETQTLGSGNLASVITLLQSAVNITLPASTTNENFLDRLETALAQYQACQEKGEQAGSDLSTPPEGAVEKQAPFIMSFSNEQLSAFVGTTNPSTGKAWTLPELQAASAVSSGSVADEVVMSHPTVKKLVEATDSLVSAMTHTARENYRKRLENLKRIPGAVAPDFAEKTIVPMIDGLVMSFDNGKPREQPIDLLLNALEQTASLRAFSTEQPQADFAEFLAMSQGADPTGGKTVDIHPMMLSRTGKEETQEEVNNRLKSWKSRGLLG